MAQPRGFGLNAGKNYENITWPQSVWVTFTVASTDTKGLGVTSVKSNGYVDAVFMHTTATPGVSNGLTNPNPQAGYAVFRFPNTFNYWLGEFSSQIVPLTATGTTALTKGNVYVITSLGNTTLAQWLAAGLAVGVNPASNTGTAPIVQTPSVGMTFVAAATASIGGTGTVGVPGVPTAFGMTIVGDPNQTISNVNVAGNSGAQVVVQFSGPTSSAVTTMVPTAPADGTIVEMKFNFDKSTVTIDGL